MTSPSEHLDALQRWAERLVASGLVRGRDVGVEGVDERPRHAELRWRGANPSVFDWGPRQIEGQTAGTTVAFGADLGDLQHKTASYWELLHQRAALPHDDPATVERNLTGLIAQWEARGVRPGDDVALARTHPAYAPRAWLAGDDGGYELGAPGERSAYDRWVWEVDFDTFVAACEPHITRLLR